MSERTEVVEVTDTYHAKAVFRRRLEALNNPLNGLDFTNNSDPSMAIFWRAREAASFGAAWKKDTLKGITTEFDLEEHIAKVEPGGASEIILRGGVFGIQCTVKRPSSRIDHTVLRNALRKAGVSQEVIDTCTEAATVVGKPPTSLEAVWLTG